MAKGDMILAGTDCEDCKYFRDNKNNKIICEARNKEYYYGQCIAACDDKEVVKE